MSPLAAGRFACITEEREEERDQDGQLTEANSAPADPLKLYTQTDADGLLSRVENGVSDELATLRSEQEQLAQDLRTLLTRQTDAVIQQTTSVGRVIWELMRGWPYSREQTAAHVRCFCGGLFLLLAVMVLIVPPALPGLR